MTDTHDLTERNADFAATAFPAGLKINPAHVLGRGDGEAAVIRNVGGRVTPATLRAMVMLGKLPGPARRVFRDPGARARAKSVSDPAGSVRVDVILARTRGTAFLVSGLVHDVSTGPVETVVAPTSLRAGQGDGAAMCGTSAGAEQITSAIPRAATGLAVDPIAPEPVDAAVITTLVDTYAAPLPGDERVTRALPGGHGQCAAWTGSEWRPDRLLLGDQALVHLRGKGLVVLTGGCGQASAINIVRHVQRLTAVPELHALLGGLHLSGPAFEPAIGPTARRLIIPVRRRPLPEGVTGPR